MSLNEKQEKFAQSYILHRNATEAARAAGYAKESAYNQGYRLLQNEEIKERIEDLEKDCKELADVIRGLDPTNPILQHLQQPTVEHDGMKYNPVNLKPYK